MTSTTYEADEHHTAISARIPQAATGNFAIPTSTETPSTAGARPFALRFGQPRIPVEGDPGLPMWRYCDEQQIALDTDGRPMMAKGEMTSTGPSPDGKGSTGNEEWTPDFAGDTSA